MRLLLVVACAVRAAAAATDTSYVQERDGALFEARKEGDVAAVRQALDAGANVNAGSPSNHQTTLFNAIIFKQADIVELLLSRGADETATSASGDSAEDYSRATLDRPVVESIEAAVAEYDYDSVAQAIQYWDDLDEPWRLEGEVERIIELLSGVRAAGSWKHYTGAWRVELLLLQRLCSAGRASPLGTPSRQAAWVWTQSIEELEATSGCKVTPRKNYEDPGDEWRTTKALMACLVDLPSPLVGKVASYWRTARDPLY